MQASDDLITTFDELASNELEGVKKWMEGLKSIEHVVLLIEACRALDYQHVLQFLSQNRRGEIPSPDFDILVSGWNGFLSLTLPHARGFRGFPFMQSTPDSMGVAMAGLHQVGRSALMRKTVAMLRYGLAVGERVGDRIVVRMSARTSADHFLDQVDVYKLADLQDGSSEQSDAQNVGDIEKKLAELVFPWSTNKGIMVGYNADSEIDRYYLELVSKNTEDWRNEAGIHPDASIGDVPGRDVALVGLLLTSLYLKHIHLVSVAQKKIDAVNIPMSLTIWKPESELAKSLSDFTGLEESVVKAAVNLFTVRHSQSKYFLAEPTPWIPMLIEVSEGYLLSPVSSIFRNPFHGVRMMNEWQSNGPSASVSDAREEWMRDELYYLFLGSRYHLVEGSTRLRRAGTTVTDIDAAILDWTTGELALFQLKWQDFNTTDVGSQRSKAKNFVTRVDQWVRQVESWIGEFGRDALCRGLRLNSEASRRISEVRLFAIGQSPPTKRAYSLLRGQVC
jgi:hypothetical protein